LRISIRRWKRGSERSSVHGNTGKEDSLSYETNREINFGALAPTITFPKELPLMRFSIYPIPGFETTSADMWLEIQVKTNKKEFYIFQKTT